MGYTHYWNDASFTKRQWGLARVYTLRLIKECSVPLRAEYDSPSKPEVDNDYICFNGVEDEGCETFVISREGQAGYCKTGRNGYDEAVVAVLMMLHKVNPDFEWTSDGDEEDHGDGIALYKSVMRYP